MNTPRVRSGPSARPAAPSTAFVPPPAPVAPPPPVEPVALYVAPTTPAPKRVTFSSSWNARGEASAAPVVVGQSGIHRLSDGVVAIAKRAVQLTFPATYPIEELRFATIPATAFAQREGDYPLWLEFQHPLDGRWRSAFAQLAWIQG